MKYLGDAVNLFKIAVTLPVAGLGLAIASIWHERSGDPVEITNAKTPVLLIHGSESNQQQFLYFRHALASGEIGHVFTVNLNKLARRNDEDRDILDYAQSLRVTLKKMKKLYADSGYDMQEVILVGNSMGGLIAAAYCVTENEVEDEDDTVHVAAVVTISTPWKGSILGDWFCSAERSPEKYFRRESDDRERLLALFLDCVHETGLPVYNYGSRFDVHVTPFSAQLPGISEGNVLIDSRNDHLTTMLDGQLAKHVSEKWIAPNTIDLPTIQAHPAEIQTREYY